MCADASLFFFFVIVPAILFLWSSSSLCSKWVSLSCSQSKKTMRLVLGSVSFGSWPHTYGKGGCGYQVGYGKRYKPSMFSHPSTTSRSQCSSTHYISYCLSSCSSANVPGSLPDWRLLSVRKQQNIYRRGAFNFYHDGSNHQPSL